MKHDKSSGSWVSDDEVDLTGDPTIRVKRYPIAKAHGELATSTRSRIENSFEGLRGHSRWSQKFGSLNDFFGFAIFIRLYDGASLGILR